MSYQPMGNHPTGHDNFFLVRPMGIYPGTGKSHTPTVVRDIDGELFTGMNEIEPIYWTKGNSILNGPTTKIAEALLEWHPLPEHASVDGSNLEEAVIKALEQMDTSDFLEVCQPSFVKVMDADIGELDGFSIIVHEDTIQGHRDAWIIHAIARIYTDCGDGKPTIRICGRTFDGRTELTSVTRV